MKGKLIGIAAIASFGLCTGPSAAQNIMDTDSYAHLRSQPYPVVKGDVTDKPYRVIGHITKSIRKQTAFSNNPTFEKIQKELWERGKRMGADAIIHASFGESDNVSAFSFSSSEARGTAIKFLSPQEIEAWKNGQLKR